MENLKRGPNPLSYWPQVVVATASVVGLPLFIISLLEAFGALRSPALSVLLAIGSSITVASAGSAYWTRRGSSKDIVFGDLMVWSWFRRMRTERHLTNARKALGLDRRSPAPEAELSPERQAEVLERLASSLESRDQYTHGHSRRVTRHSHMIAKRMGLSREQVEKVRAAAAMHDVGKLNISRAVLNKPGKLSDEEFEVIKRHPTEGADMVAGVGDPEITAMVRHHHERLDGSGYPDGLPGDRIPLGARIIAVADTFDAITSTRPYRPARQHKQAIAVLREEAGRQLDPNAVGAFLGYYSGRRSIVRWTLVTAAVQRFLAWLAGPIESASASSITQGAVAVAATAALGTSLVSPAASADRRPDQNPAQTRSSQLVQHAGFRAGQSAPGDDSGRSHSSDDGSRAGDRHEQTPDPDPESGSVSNGEVTPEAGPPEDGSTESERADDRPDRESPDDREMESPDTEPASDADPAEESGDPDRESDGKGKKKRGGNNHTEPPEEDDSPPEPDNSGSGSDNSGPGSEPDGE